MRSLPRALVLLLLFAPFIWGGLTAADKISADGLPAYDRKLGARIEARLAKAGVTQYRYGIAVLERGTGDVVYFGGQALPLVPASVAKVLTSASALDALGPAYRFSTDVIADGPTEGDRIDGNLRVRGGADPTLADIGADALGVLRRLAREIVDHGVRQVSGDLVLDDRLFDHEFTHDDWTDADKRHGYGAGVGALSLNEGSLVLRATGARSTGTKATLALPMTAGPWAVTNRVKTAAGGRSAIGARFGKGTLTATGSVPAGKTGSIRVPVPDPGLFFGGAFLSALRKAGIEIRGRVRRATAADPTDGRVLARYESDLASALKEMNVSSRNPHASMLFKLAGARVTGLGTWSAGTQAVTRMAEGRGIAAGGTQIVDGSGLAPSNRVTAGLLAQVLHSFDRDPLRGPVLLDSLPVSGTSGTLRRRLGTRDLKGRVHAKTGTLNDIRVRSLAGYIDSRKGTRGTVFAIVLRGRGANHAVIDDLVRMLDRR